MMENSSLYRPTDSSVIPDVDIVSTSIDNITENNLTRNETEVEDPSMVLFQQVVSVVVPVIFGLICLLGFVGNLFVIIVVVANKQMRSTTNLLIINLAFADFVFIVVCVPFTALSYSSTVWPFGTAFCRVYQYVIHVTAHASVYTLVLMSLDRFLAVVYPIWSMTIRTERNAYIAIFVSWVVICAANSPMIPEFQVVVFPPVSYCLNQRLIENPEHGRTFYITFFVFAFLLPLSMVTCLYILMIQRLLYPSKSRGITSSSSESMKAKRRVTRMVIVVVVIFAICWFPLHAMFLVQFVGEVEIDLKFLAFRMFANCLAYMNSCVNPILYAFLSENFRVSFRRLLLICFGRLMGKSQMQIQRQQRLRSTMIERTSIRGLQEEPMARLFNNSTDNDHTELEA